MTLDDWNTLLQFASAILLGLTFAVGVGAIWTGYVLGKRQEARIAATENGTAEANRKAAEAGERASKLEVEAEKQRERAAKAERDLLELKQRMAPRHISAAQGAKLAVDLKPLAGKQVAVFIISGQPENEAFGDELASALKRAGLNVQIQPGAMFGAPVKPGLSLMIGRNRLADANSLSNALIDAGLASRPIPAETTATDELLHITVAPK